jgi:NADH:quinone reductase (non-electrogenic)
VGLYLLPLALHLSSEQTIRVSTKYRRISLNRGDLKVETRLIGARTDGHRPRVLILGGGFAGIRAARGLADLPVDVTLVDRRNHHTFQPLLYQVALAVLSPANIAQPIRSIFRDKRNIEVLMDEAIGFDLERRRARMHSGVELEYDYLIVATGSTHSYFGKNEWAQYAPGLKTVEDATEIRRRVLLAFELAERQMLETGTHPPLNFVVIGGGPTGVELAGAITDIAKLYMRHDFRHIDPSKACVLILEGAPRILANYPEDLSRKAEEQLKRLGVEVHTGTHVTDVGPGYVMTGNRKIASVVTLWAAGVQASPVGRLLGVETDRRGCVIVDQYLNPKGHPEIFVCGDLAHVEEGGRQIPGVAQPAMQMGNHAALMIKDDLEGKPRSPFHYFDKGDMATIGRQAAVAKVEWPFKAHWSGFLAWLTWLVVHIYFLIGFRNRLVVLWEWAWGYFSFTRGARLITGDQNLVGWNEQEGAIPQKVSAVPLDMTSPGATHKHSISTPDAGSSSSRQAALR